MFCLPCGRLTDRFGARAVLVTLLGGLGATVPHHGVWTYTQVVAYAVAMGVSGGVVTVVFFFVWGQVFGRSHLRNFGWSATPHQKV
jgi:MFS family permease